jgi:hypothetical protein
MIYIPVFKGGTRNNFAPKGAYRTELIKRKKERLFCPSLIPVAVSVIIIFSPATASIFFVTSYGLVSRGGPSVVSSSATALLQHLSHTETAQDSCPAGGSGTHQR